MSKRRVRATFVALALSTILAGLFVHWHATWLSPAARDVLGDALWAMMIVWWIGALAPSARLAPRAGFALGICWVVELSQLYHTRTLDAWRLTLPGQLVLGSGFDVRDLGSYAAGVTVAALLELTVRQMVA